MASIKISGDTSGAITIAMEGQTFDAGSAEIYGLK